MRGKWNRGSICNEQKWDKNGIYSIILTIFKIIARKRGVTSGVTQTVTDHIPCVIELLLLFAFLCVLSRILQLHV